MNQKNVDRSGNRLSPVPYTQSHAVIKATTPQVHIIPNPLAADDDLTPADTREFPPAAPPPPGEEPPPPFPNPGIPALVPPLLPPLPAVDETVVPQAPTTEDKSVTLLRAAGVAPQFAAWVIQTELPSKSKTATEEKILLAHAQTNKHADI